MFLLEHKCKKIILFLDIAKKKTIYLVLKLFCLNLKWCSVHCKLYFGITNSWRSSHVLIGQWVAQDFILRDNNVNI